MRYIFIENDTVVLALDDAQLNGMTPYMVAYTQAETIHIQTRAITADTLIQRWHDAELCLYCEQERVESAVLDEAILEDYLH